jgi:hypothetical protein
MALQFIEMISFTKDGSLFGFVFFVSLVQVELCMRGKGSKLRTTGVAWLARLVS